MDKNRALHKLNIFLNKYNINMTVFLLYLILRLLVVFAGTVAFFRGDYESVFICILTLWLFMMPMVIERTLAIDLPSTLEVIILLFIFAAEILGEIGHYYITFPHWDTMLHTINGFLFAAVGFSLIDILCRNNKIKFDLAPIYVAIAAFCFSMTVGVLWEFFEYGMDSLFSLDMQKDTVIQNISSVTLDPDKGNNPILISGIEEVIVNGEKLDIDGYLDIGLHDTMEDLIVNFIGATIFSFIGYFYIKNRGKGNFAKHFIPVLRSNIKKISKSKPD